MTVEAIIAAKLKNDEITEDDRSLAMGEVEQVILNYCAIDEVPAALTYTWVNMAVDLLRYQHEVSRVPDEGEGEGGGVVTGAVSSITEGDTTVSFGGVTQTADLRKRNLDGHQAKLDELVLNYRAQLQKFRRVKWG